MSEAPPTLKEVEALIARQGRTLQPASSLDKLVMDAEWAPLKGVFDIAAGSTRGSAGCRSVNMLLGAITAAFAALKAALGQQPDYIVIDGGIEDHIRRWGGVDQGNGRAFGLLRSSPPGEPVNGVALAPFIRVAGKQYLFVAARPCGALSIDAVGELSHTLSAHATPYKWAVVDGVDMTLSKKPLPVKQAAVAVVAHEAAAGDVVKDILRDFRRRSDAAPVPQSALPDVPPRGETDAPLASMMEAFVGLVTDRLLADPRLNKQVLAIVGEAFKQSFNNK